jgi:hypothetical protein
VTKKTTKSGEKLELWVANAYRNMGAWKAEHNVPMAGHQIDVYVEIAGLDHSLHRIAVETKHWKSRVGIDVVRDWVLVVDDLRRAGLVDEGVILSSLGFTQPARQAVAEHVRRGLPVRLLELADLEAIVAEAKAAERSCSSTLSSPPSCATTAAAGVNGEPRRAESLDTRILKILYHFLQKHPGDPQMDLNEMVGVLESERADVLQCLYGLQEKGWVDYNLTERAESGLLWLTRLGTRVAKAAQ